MKVDVLVVGGGVIGTACAYYLAREGKEVALIEREESICPIGCATYANAGMISPTGIYPLPHPGVLGQGLRWLLDSSSCFYIKPRPSLDLARWLLKFVAASRSEPMSKTMPVLRDLGVQSLGLFEELDSEGAIHAGYEQKGILNLYNTQAALEGAIADIEPMKAFGIETAILDAAEVRRRVPAALPSVLGGTFVPEDGKIDPRAFAQELAAAARSMGATVLTATEALGFASSGRRVTSVRTTRGTFEPGAVVLAAGVWSAHLARSLGVRLPIQASKGYSVTIERPEGIPEDLPLYLTEAHVCVTPYGDDLRFAGTLELSGINTRVLHNRVEGIRKGAKDFLEGAGTEPKWIWRGLRSLTTDGLPIVGRPRALDNLVVATGHNMNGIKFGPITGRLVAQMIDGQRTALDVGPLSVDRFN